MPQQTFDVIKPQIVMKHNFPIGTFITPNGIINGLWAMPRPLTHHWGSGQILKRLEKIYGMPDIIFGKQDNVGNGEFFTADNDPETKPSLVADWSNMPLKDNSYRFGYWDPPYLGKLDSEKGVHYNRLEPCIKDICRVVSERLFILHPLVYPCPKGWRRIAVIAITYGPNKIIRSLQGFQKEASP